MPGGVRPGALQGKSGSQPVLIKGYHQRIQRTAGEYTKEELLVVLRLQGGSASAGQVR